jgi:hypothetical protein
MASHIPELYEDASKLHSLLCIHVDKATEKPDAKGLRTTSEKGQVEKGSGRLVQRSWGTR